MNLLFYFDSERVYTDKNGNYYASGNFPKDVWNRYLKYCDSLYVIMREGNGIVDKDNPKNRKEKIDDPRIKVFLVKDLYGGITDYLNQKYRRYNKKLVETMINKSDFVIVRSFSNPVVNTAIKYHKPYMIEVVGSAWDALWNHGIKGKVLALPSEYAAKRIVKNAPWVLYVTSEFLQHQYPTNGHNTGISDVVIEVADRQVLDRRIERIQTKKGSLILGTAAAVDVRYKGQEYVIKAVGRLKKKGIRVIYEMAGLGEKEYLENVARECGVLDQVRFAGQLSHDKVFEWMDNIDVYIQPSLLEGLPRSVVEAMSRGLPVLGTDAGGISELIGRNELFQKKSVSEIENQITAMGKKRLEKLSKENFERAKSYEKEVLDKKRDNFYQDFCFWAEKHTKKAEHIRQEY